MASSDPPQHHHGLSIEPPEAFGADDFRRTLGHFASGVTIVTGSHGGGQVGLTCQSFFAVSLDPPLVAFSPAKTSHSYPRIRAAGAFCVNILAEAQQDLGRVFSRSGADKWADVRWTAGVTGSPILDGVLAWVDCDLEAEHEAGDHWLVLGRVRALQGSDHRPLVYFRSAFERLG